ncbi:hypothetical protein BMI85_17235 [Thioclava sp. DLFJ4-1]|nr:hypothetical protein BMI89_14635 [Thioclava sp. F36-7]OOY15277.1 hypothetical protein BMI85_17235 [Thioclava sp. DLFJ4-1]OOY32408.1 hypothetical protein BMI88_00480 [Thioclava sp. F36-6]
MSLNRREIALFDAWMGDVMRESHGSTLSVRWASHTLLQFFWACGYAKCSTVVFLRAKRL